MSPANRKRPASPASSPRRTPTQDRSRRLVASLIDATAHVLSEVGVEGLSTNKVAKAAGVSPASIYQYFPDKEALVDALVEDRFGRLAQLALDRMGEVQGLSFAQAAETVLRAAVDFFASEPGLTPILAPYLAVPPAVLEADSTIQHVQHLTTVFLATAASETEVTITDVDLAAFVSIGVVSHFAPRIAVIPDRARRERLLTEVVKLLVSYVGATRPTSPKN